MVVWEWTCGEDVMCDPEKRRISEVSTADNMIIIASLE